MVEANRKIAITPQSGKRTAFSKPFHGGKKSPAGDVDFIEITGRSGTGNNDAFKRASKTPRLGTGEANKPGGAFSFVQADVGKKKRPDRGPLEQVR